MSSPLVMGLSGAPGPRQGEGQAAPHGVCDREQVPVVGEGTALLSFHCSVISGWRWPGHTQGRTVLASAPICPVPCATSATGSGWGACSREDCHSAFILGKDDACGHCRCRALRLPRSSGVAGWPSPRPSPLFWFSFSLLSEGRVLPPHCPVSLSPCVPSCFVADAFQSLDPLLCVRN